MSDNFVSASAAGLWTTQQGEGIALLLCNGGPGCADYLGPVAEMVADCAAVIRWEQAGCGRSDPRPPYTIHSCMDDMEAIRLHYGIDRWIVGGHSWGADLALCYTLAHHAHVAGLICLAGGRIHNDRDWHAVYHRNKERIGEALPETAYPPNLEVNEQLNRDWKRYIHRPTLLRELADMHLPAMFLYGDQDIRPRWPVEQVAHLLPEARWILLQGAPHLLWLTHVEEVKAHLRRFVLDIQASMSK